VDEYRRQVKELLLDKHDVAANDVKALLQFREDNQIDFEVRHSVALSIEGE
jgi:hypothetical protein